MLNSRIVPLHCVCPQRCFGKRCRPCELGFGVHFSWISSSDDGLGHRSLLYQKHYQKQRQKRACSQGKVVPENAAVDSGRIVGGERSQASATDRKIKTRTSYELFVEFVIAPPVLLHTVLLLLLLLLRARFMNMTNVCVRRDCCPLFFLCRRSKAWRWTMHETAAVTR